MAARETPEPAAARGFVYEGIPLRSKFLKTLLLIQIVLTPILASCQIWGDGLYATSSSSRILFIGNSFTYINSGVDQEMKGLDPSLQVRRVAVGGYTLKDHWNAGDALSAIREAKWDYVVLQDQSQIPVISTAQFVEYAAKFDREVRQTGGKTILFMTWERPDSLSVGVTTQNLADAYFNAGNQRGVKVAPVGLAFARALANRPDLELYVQDGHPTETGTYLAASVLYATILDKSPLGLSYSPPSMPDAEKQFLQRTAAEFMGY